MVSAADAACVGRVRASPNHGDRVGHAAPDSLILHYTGMADGASAIDWLCEPVSQVSCHYVVEENGGIVQLVPESRRAWHAGRSSWHGHTDMNSASVGIEIVNGGHDFGLPPFGAAQIRAVITLGLDIVARHHIRPERVLAHSDIAPGRKLDPGERFPWAELHAAGLGHWVPERHAADEPLGPGDTGRELAELQATLKLYGYAVDASGVYDDMTRAAVEAFQRHFRPSRVDGIADAGTRATLRELIDRLPRENVSATS